MRLFWLKKGSCGSMFEDSPQPFDPHDNLPKPKVGDIVYLKLMEGTEGIPMMLRVEHIWDSLAESWDPIGEHAWKMRDRNEDIGWRGHWYALAVDPQNDADEWVVASYEVGSIASK